MIGCDSRAANKGESSLYLDLSHFIHCRRLSAPPVIPLQSGPLNGILAFNLLLYFLGGLEEMICRFFAVYLGVDARMSNDRRPCSYVLACKMY